MLMTMELWQLGFAMDRGRLALLVVLALPLLVGVAHRIGFEPSFGWREDLRDAFIALGIGIVASAGGARRLRRDRGPACRRTRSSARSRCSRCRPRSGRCSGAASSAASARRTGDTRALSGYFGALFLMLVGALFLSLNVAPTEEMVLIAYMMTPWHALALVALSIALMHGFVFALEFHGGAPPRARPAWLEPLPALHPRRLRAGAGDQPLRALDLRPHRRHRRRRRC